MGSSRLPGKVLKELAGRSVLDWVVRAVRESEALDDLVVATTMESIDDGVVEECERLGVAWHRGPVDDVLTRFVGALRDHPGDAVMRFTADCPLLDPAVIREAALVYRAVPGLDYLSTGLPHTLPRGTDVEIVGRAALAAADLAATGYHRTHVTSYIYSHAAGFRVLGLTYKPSAADLRVTLDTQEDWELLQAVVQKFGDRTIDVRELVDWLRAHPEVCAINADVRQKELQEA